MRERCKRDGALGQAYSCVKSPTGATLRTGRSEYATEQLRFNYAFEGRPCRALFLFIPAIQGLVALAGLRTLGFGGVAPIGAYSPSRSQQSKEYNLQHKGPRALHPPPRYCASIHGHCGISSQGAAVCAPKAPQFCSRALRYFLSRCCSMCSQGTAVLLTGPAVFPLKVLQYVLPRHRSSAHRYCGISSRDPAVCAPKGAWYGPQGASGPLSG